MVQAGGAIASTVRSAARGCAVNAVRHMMRAVRDAGGLGSALHERLAGALTYLMAPQRASAAAADWEAYHAIVAGDLPNIDWPAVGGTSMEQVKQAREDLARALAPLAIEVGGACEDMRCQWRAAAQHEVARRDEREAHRGWLRVCMRAWREASDGLPAGAAAFDQRWARGEDCALARRLRIGEGALRKWGEVEWLAVRRLLTWQRLVRAGHVHRMRRRSPAWQAAREAAHRSAWYSCLPHAQGHDTHEHDEQVAQWRRAREQQQQTQHARKQARQQPRGEASGMGALGSSAPQQHNDDATAQPSHVQLEVEMQPPPSPPTNTMPASGKRKQRQEEETGVALPHNGSSAQRTGAQLDVCEICDDGAGSSSAAGGAVAAAVAAAHGGGSARAREHGRPTPSSSSSSENEDDCNFTGQIHSGENAAERNAAPAGRRRTRRTDHILALTTHAQASLRCLLGGGETRLVHAQRRRGDG